MYFGSVWICIPRTLRLPTGYGRRIWQQTDQQTQLIDTKTRYWCGVWRNFPGKCGVRLQLIVWEYGTIVHRLLVRQPFLCCSTLYLVQGHSFPCARPTKFLTRPPVRFLRYNIINKFFWPKKKKNNNLFSKFMV